LKKNNKFESQPLMAISIVWFILQRDTDSHQRGCTKVFPQWAVLFPALSG